jgi:hypothetical protein
MDLGSIFLVFTVVLLVGLYISRPFIDRQRASLSTPVIPNENRDQENSALMAEYDRVLNTLQEMDFDYVLGKIPDEDYHQQRTFILQSGADLLRQLDTSRQQSSGLSTSENSLSRGESLPSAEDRLEAAIAARRADSPVHQPAPVIVANGPNDDLEALISLRRGARQGKAAGFCPKCGKPVQVSDRFCPKCGAPVKVS